ncbi:sulfate adenylyltransferase subunit CysN [Methylococcus capsulatus]|uniref:sulfate adenylyltransferase subunit CysN n=1 Tax=Methylococcus capsulatus TaxID=414 RepID=UPI001C52AF62|nr:sulfate adenylyltransferase subunit CysN [Methylococcus capsulatus]QXP86821.1 sulfate adenylyltransferase subunit CysN [Methylococcus capsulatus]QXP93501.1 sulfate adenylyltransferase subunit CysN [Methylococcus capsulatus]
MSHQSDLIGTDIHAYLAQHERKELLRLLTCGSVDDGKSTLIGRLLHDSQMIYEDQLSAVRRDSVKSGTTGGELDLALLVDGLQAEREQGITIDVAYRYFSTTQRKFIIADTPGHEQYTRNMATGASTCDLAIILIDARHGVQVQTRRHSYIVSLLGIRHVLVAINKMDLVDHSEAVFDRIRADYLAFADKLELHDVRFIPISALNGDNVVHRSAAMPWYGGPSLIELLNTLEIAQDRNFDDPRFPVQYVNRPHLDFRGYSGTVAAGVFRPGDPVLVLPAKTRSRIQSIVTYDGELEAAFPPQAVTLTLEDEIDVSRGDLLVHPDRLPYLDSRFEAHVVWMTEAPLIPGKQYLLKHATRTLSGSVAVIRHRIDVNTLERHPAGQLNLNEIGLCELALSAPLAFDPYARCKGTGAFIVIDRLTNVTVGAGMIAGPVQGETGFRKVTAEERAARFGQKAVTVWLTGPQRHEMAYRLERALFDIGHPATVLEDEGFGAELIRAAQLVNHAGLICLCPLMHADFGAGEGRLMLSVEGRDVADLIEELRRQGVLS